MPNCPNGHILEHIVKFQPATVTGELIGAGWSASMGYPGIKDPQGDTYMVFSSILIILKTMGLSGYILDEFIRTEVTVERYDELDVQPLFMYLKKIKSLCLIKTHLL